MAKPHLQPRYCLPKTAPAPRRLCHVQWPWLPQYLPTQQLVASRTRPTPSLVASNAYGNFCGKNNLMMSHHLRSGTTTSSLWIPHHYSWDCSTQFSFLNNAADSSSFVEKGELGASSRTQLVATILHRHPRRPNSSPPSNPNDHFPLPRIPSHSTNNASPSLDLDLSPSRSLMCCVCQDAAFGCKRRRRQRGREL